MIALRSAPTNRSKNTETSETYPTNGQFFFSDSIVSDHRIGPVRTKLLLFTVAIFVTGRLGAGVLELQPKETAPPTITESQPWQFTIAAPGWLASMNGTIGVRRVNADIDVPVDEVLQHLDMIFAMRAEAQKGPLGIFGEFIYIGLSDGAQINGLINNIHEQVDLSLVDGALSWRLFNQPRWSVDFAAGTQIVADVVNELFARLLNRDRVGM